VEAHEYNIRFFLVVYMCDLSENAEQLNFVANLVTIYCVCMYICSKNLTCCSLVPYILIFSVPEADIW